jgi:hypothetical protein
LTEFGLQFFELLF